MQPTAGDLLLITDRASVQFAACPPFLFRVIRQHEWPTYWNGWGWIDGYQLDPNGVARTRRSIYVQFTGLIPVRRQPASRSRTRHRGTTVFYPNTRPTIGRTRPRSYTDVEPERY